jgi:predicted RND superfamily exporter protein
MQEFQANLNHRPELRKIISTAEWQVRLTEWDHQRKQAQQRSLTAAANLQFGQAADEAATATTFYVQSLAFQKVFKNWLNDKAQQDAYRVTFMVFDPGTGFRPLLDDVRAHLPEEDFDCFYTGSAASVAVLSEQLMGGITRSMIAAMVAMGLVCLFLFRSVRLTLIAVAPNAFPVLVVFGFMGLFNIPLNCGSAMVTTIALGVGLNDTVHFVMHYRGRRLEGADTETALKGTFGEIGRPIIITSIVNCVGFGIFMLSDFLPMAHFGLLASIAMAAALVGDLVLLPNLLRLFDQRAWLPATGNASQSAESQMPALNTVQSASE